jgi:D-tyrosyl-tRNA(Tyr) deacylase
MVLVGIGNQDTSFELDWLAGKLANMRLFPDAESESWGWKKSVMDIHGDVLCGQSS